MHELDHVDASVIKTFSHNGGEFALVLDLEMPGYIYLNSESGDECRTVLQFRHTLDKPHSQSYQIEDVGGVVGFLEQINGDDWVLHERPNMNRRVISHGSRNDALCAASLHFLNKR